MKRIVILGVTAVAAFVASQYVPDLSLVFVMIGSLASFGFLGVVTKGDLDS